LKTAPPAPPPSSSSTALATATLNKGAAKPVVGADSEDAATPVPNPLQPLSLPVVTLRTTKVVNALGHEMAVQLQGARESSFRFRRDPRSDRTTLTLGEWVDGLCRAVMEIGLRSIGPAHPVLVEVSEEVLMSPLVEVVDPRWAVIQLPENLAPTPVLRERLRDLRARGMLLSMSCNAANAARMQGITAHAQWVHLDIGQHDRAALAGMWPDLGGHQVHVRGVDRLDDFREYRALGVHAYSGPLLSAPVTWSVEQLPACNADGLHHLWGRLMLGADDVELAGLIECDPALTLRLMILACDGLLGPVCRPESILDLVSRLRGPCLPIWLELLHVDARAHASCLQLAWSDSAAHLSLFMRLLIERLSPERRDLQGQAALLGLIAHYRHTLPERMVGQSTAPLMCPAIEDAWSHRQCLLGAVLDIGLRLMCSGQPMAPANGIIELYDEAGRLVRERRSAMAGEPQAAAGTSG
jgi:hypothetical protein